MSIYSAPIRDMKFNLKELVGLEDISSLSSYKEYTEDLVDAVLGEAGKFATGILDPLNRNGDKEGAKLTKNDVVSPAGFKEAFHNFSSAGWSSLCNDVKWGGQGLPHILSSQTSEMWNASCMSFFLCPMLTASAVHALTLHGSEQQKQTYLPNLISGKWTGTMQLTESQAGSDLSAVKTKAIPEGDHFRITGTKIYITWGEHDLTENIIHLVLARTPNSPEGVKGISLFIVPKYLVNENGGIGQRNDIKCISIEKKIGIHASPTCVISHGEKDGAIGYLVGKENEGLRYMFSMMNMARLEVGIEGMALSDRSYQHALNFAKNRTQGRLPGIKSGDRVTIINHPDVKRMLLDMKSQTESMRSMCTVVSAHLDRALKDDCEESRFHHQAMFDLLTPVVKGWCTEQSIEITSLGIQVHGGMGFIEETGAAQFYRDARITPIYEGTTGIQANDLVGRKIISEGGKTIAILIQEMKCLEKNLNINDDPRIKKMLKVFNRAILSLEESVKWILDSYSSYEQNIYAGSVTFLKLLGIVFGGWLMIRSAIISVEALRKKSNETSFYNSKISTALYFVEHQLVIAEALKEKIVFGNESIINIKTDQL